MTEPVQMRALGTRIIRREQAAPPPVQSVKDEPLTEQQERDFATVSARADAIKSAPSDDPNLASKTLEYLDDLERIAGGWDDFDPEQSKIRAAQELLRTRLQEANDD